MLGFLLLFFYLLRLPYFNLVALTNHHPLGFLDYYAFFDYFRLLYNRLFELTIYRMILQLFLLNFALCYCFAFDFRGVLDVELGQFDSDVFVAVGLKRVAG